MKAQKHQLKFKSASSNPRATSWNPLVTSPNPQFTSSNPQITNSKPRFTSSNSRIIKSMKIQVNSFKISSFPKIISLKLFGNSWGNSVSGDNLLFYVSTTQWLRLQQEVEWVNINFERRDQKFTLPTPMILEKFALSFAFNLRK